MSKPVRIRGDVVAQVEVVAERERRSFANMVEVLLLSALAGADGTVGGNAGRAGRGSYEAVVSADAGVLKTAPSVPVSAESVPAEVHSVQMAKTLARDRALRDGECRADTPRGLKCKLCGKVH